MKNVLIVDDGAFMRILIRGMLTQNGYTVVGEAEDGSVAIDKYKTLKPDLVTMDITMPKKDGIFALKDIMAYDPQASVIMVSALGQDQYVKEAILCGAKGFVVKPFDEGAFMSVIEGI